VRQWSLQTCSVESWESFVVNNRCGARGTKFISFTLLDMKGIHLTMADALDAMADALDLTHLGLA